MEAKTRSAAASGAQSAWREVFGRFDGSGESVVGFCKREGLHTQQLSTMERQRLAPTTARGARARRRRASKRPASSRWARWCATGRRERLLEVRLELGGGVVLQLVRG